MTAFTYTFTDDEDMGPANERLALARAFMQVHLYPEVTAITNEDMATMVVRGSNPYMVALAAACIQKCGSTMEFAKPLTAV